MSEIKTNKISPRKGTTQTIGDSGDTISIPCGVTTTNAGTITTAGITGGTINNSGGTLPSIRGVIEWDTTAKTTAFTAESNKGYFCNTTSAAFTVTLPASPTAGDVIGLKDYANTFDTNNLTLNGNGNNLDGGTGNGIISVEGSSVQLIYVDATRGWVLTDASKASDIAEAAAFITATGGCITTCGDFKIHTFTGPGTFNVTQIGNAPTVPTGGPQNVDYLVVAGGGAGGQSPDGGGFYASGAGAGGYRTTFPSPGCNSGAFPISITCYPITVGGGGSTSISPNQGGQGSNSVFSTITSTGGGGGGGAGNGPYTPGGSGGSGGGASFASAGPLPIGSIGSGNTPPVSPPQGNNGGRGGGTTGVTVGAGGGGGGASAVGGNSPTPGPGANAGDGGAGSTNSISGSPTAYAGGGGGKAPVANGSGGTGGGGGGGVSGTVNTGGGGGGAVPGGAGGSGIVIIRYKYQ